MPDEKDISIRCQVAFKESCSQATVLGLNLTVPEHQAVFEEMFSYLNQSLDTAVRAGLTGGVAEAVIRHFPGSTVVPQQQAAQYQQPPAPPQGGYQQPQAPTYGAQQQQPQQQMTLTPPRVKGQTNGPFPDWALQAFAEQGVTEIYDNRHMLAQSPKRPWFKSTTGGDNAPAFWPPDR